MSKNQNSKLLYSEEKVHMLNLFEFLYLHIINYYVYNVFEHSISILKLF